MTSAEAPDPLDYAEGLPPQPQPCLGGLVVGSAGAVGGDGRPSDAAEGGGRAGGRGAAGQQNVQDPAVTLSDLDSIRELLTEEEAGAHHGLIEIFRGHTFVGMVSDSIVGSPLPA